MFFMHKHKRHHSQMGHGEGLGRESGRESRGGPRGGGRRRLFDGTSLRLILLRLIDEQPRHGYDLIREIEELSGGMYAPSPGVVYPTLTMLVDMGFIEEVPSEGSRKDYSITASGSAHLTENHDAVEALIERIKRMGSDRGSADHTPIARALDNLNSVLRHRLSRDGTAMNNVHDAAAIIDGAAQAIERL